MYWVLLPLGVAAFILGERGYHSYEEGATASDAIYGAIKLFFLHAAPQPENNVGWALDVARFVAPVVAGWAGIIALVSLFRERVQQLLIPFKRGHVVVCGLGDVGLEFATRLHTAGRRVVVIEADGDNPQIATCRDWGYPVVVGDAQLRSVLDAAGVRRAARLLAVTRDSVVNTEIVTSARRLSASAIRGRGGTRTTDLRCLARIDDPGLGTLLRAEEVNQGDVDSMLDFFSIDELGARLLLGRYPLDVSGRPHIVLGQLDELGARLVFHAARHWHDERPDSAVPLVVTVFGDQARNAIDDLVGRHPALEDVCEFHCRTGTARDLENLAATRADGTDAPVSSAYITGPTDEEAVKAALTLRRTPGWSAPIVAVVRRAYGVAELLERIGGPGDHGVRVFRVFQEACGVQLVEGGSYEAIAHAVHERYRRMAPPGAAVPDWQRLPEDLKESSRAQARHIGVKLRSVGCVITPLRDWHARDFRFTEQEVYRLGGMEHDRWMAEKLAAGWTLGDEDRVRKRDPHLVPNEELPDDIAEIDLAFVRAIPEMLAEVGLQVTDTRPGASRYPTERERVDGVDALH